MFFESVIMWRDSFEYPFVQPHLLSSTWHNLDNPQTLGYFQASPFAMVLPESGHFLILFPIPTFVPQGKFNLVFKFLAFVLPPSGTSPPSPQTDFGPFTPSVRLKSS